jgi:hypothetical protein
MIAFPRVEPSHGPLAVGGQIWAITRAELAMQWRRWGIWLVFAFATSLILVTFSANANAFRHLSPQSIYARLHFTSLDSANFLTLATTYYADLIFGIVSALLIADRIGRDRQLGMFELQRATPLGCTRYLLGKFVGNYMAVLVPTFLSSLFCVLVLMVLGAPSLFLQRFLLAFSLVFVPVYTAVVGVTLLLASFLPIRIVQMSFPLLWLYSNLSPLGWHTINDTILNPNGQYIYPIFFSTPLTRLYASHATLQQALLNITLLVVTALVALLLTYGSLMFQQRQMEGTEHANT